MIEEKWYEIDVKRQVVIELTKILPPASGQYLLNHMSEYSVRDLMESDYWEKVPNITNSLEPVEYAAKLYSTYRSTKYGQEGFWNSALKERIIGYNGTWHEFITSLLNQYVECGDKVLFVGTADGSEIPTDQVYNYYAFEQIDNSVQHIDTGKVVARYKGDFEDTALRLNGGCSFNAIIALRCLMPNTRLDKFFAFVDNNLAAKGLLILSHPLSYLDRNGKLAVLEGAKEKRIAFDERLNTSLFKTHYMIVKELETAVEYIYILKRDDFE